MAKPSRDNTGLSLLQTNPSREVMLEKMRNKLASKPSSAQVQIEHKRDKGRRAATTWTIRALVLLALAAVNYLLIGNGELIAAKLSKPAVPRLPAPALTASADERALYYAYALYDSPKLKERYGVSGFYAVDQADAKRKLEALLPEISPRALGTISGYTPVAFKSAGTEISP
jgi:hypothetical protein